ncbi:amino acid ABC transporter permease [Ralstonia solanacearum]|uniref:amino acid ABC transporter permease n=1 Tax=Ralstonia solanacearum TaxID=305 RepID=UPI002029E265|nr:amino acid ABC transporter permease [Ralstonia solanacearum]MCL9843964.1 amino acid ABC transporter permease [Ralstonia solanacearum]MDC6253669.1 amino acid ABC transporter permease [Ralstonia solanacearum]MDC6258246.1 amino acid ABC transporter permease [Ralstonia solanacearum]MDC6302782.1 amino acid ABC transporter permease [Ralstonia solanacearum]
MTAEALLLHLRYLLVGPFPNGPLGGAALTLWMALLACAASTAAGIAFALLLDRLDHLGTRAAGLACALRGTLATLRAVPVLMLMLMFWAYFLIPMALGVAVPETTTVVTALAAVGAAYIAQSMQAGLLAVGTGQRNAALALGMSPGQALLTVVLPQAWRIMLPSVANQWVSTVKDTSLAYIVGVVELSTAASQVNSRIVAYPAEVFAAVAGLYFVLCSGIELLPRWLRAGAAARSAAAARVRPWRGSLRWRARPVADTRT